MLAQLSQIVLSQIVPRVVILTDRDYPKQYQDMINTF
jgi:hypothetical protein